MTIKNFDHLQNSIWDWSILNGCFGESTIGVSDIDGIVHLKGNFLMFECKFKPHDIIPKGQELMIKALAATKLFTVVLLWGDKSPEMMKVYYPDGRETEKKKAGLEDLRNVTKWWYEKNK